MDTNFKSIHEIPVLDIDGNKVEPLGVLTQHRKCIMVVNVASK
jgi:glutathione peroxidase-family protein